MDELLHQLLKKLSQHQVGSQEHTIALEHLLAVVPFLPNILEDEHPEYLKALDKTLKDVRKKIDRCLVEPRRQQLSDCFWNERGWDIIFFAGHSSTDSEKKGSLYINSNDISILSFYLYYLPIPISPGLMPNFLCPIPYKTLQ